MSSRVFTEVHAFLYGMLVFHLNFTILNRGVLLFNLNGFSYTFFVFSCSQFYFKIAWSAKSQAAGDAHFCVREFKKASNLET
jgi:hypothetical protein